MKIKQKTKFVVEFSDVEVNQIYDWLAAVIDETDDRARMAKLITVPQAIRDLRGQLYASRHGV